MAALRRKKTLFKMINLILNKIRIDENRNEQVIIFKEEGGERFLPVVIGMSEVNAIKLKLSGVKPPRPLTHDLLYTVVDSLGARFEKVVIDRLEENTFFAKLYLRSQDDREIIVDARPSDSVAIALRANIPILIDEMVIDQAGVTEI